MQAQIRPPTDRNVFQSRTDFLRLRNYKMQYRYVLLYYIGLEEFVRRASRPQLKWFRFLQGAVKVQGILVQNKAVLVFAMDFQIFRILQMCSKLTNIQLIECFIRSELAKYQPKS